MPQFLIGSANHRIHYTALFPSHGTEPTQFPPRRLPATKSNQPPNLPTSDQCNFQAISFTFSEPFLSPLHLLPPLKIPHLPSTHTSVSISGSFSPCSNTLPNAPTLCLPLSNAHSPVLAAFHCITPLCFLCNCFL